EGLSAGTLVVAEVELLARGAVPGLHVARSEQRVPVDLLHAQDHGVRPRVEISAVVGVDDPDGDHDAVGSDGPVGVGAVVLLVELHQARGRLDLEGSPAGGERESQRAEQDQLEEASRSQGCTPSSEERPRVCTHGNGSKASSCTGWSATGANVAVIV